MVKKNKRRAKSSAGQSSTSSAQQSVPTQQEFPELGSHESQATERPVNVRPEVSMKAIASDIKSETTVRPRLDSRSGPSSSQTNPIESEPSVKPKAGPSGGKSETPPKPAESPAEKPKQTKDEREALAQEFEEKLIMRPPPPPKRPFAKRPDSLTIGNPIQLLTNHFLLRVGAKQAFHYDIEIESVSKPSTKDDNIVDRDVAESTKQDKKNKYTRKIGAKMNRKIFEQMIRTYSGSGQVFNGINPVYDGQKNMFTSKILDGTAKGINGERKSIRLKVELKENERTSVFYVNIKLAETNETIDLNTLNLYHKGRTCDDEVVKKSILFINTLLRHNSTMKMIPIGQSIYDPINPGQEIGQFVLLSYGHYSSVRNLMIGPTINVDRSAACFYKPSRITDLIGSIIRGDLSRVPELSVAQKRTIKKELAGLQVEATHIPFRGTTGNYFRKYRVLGVSIKSAKEHTFEWKERDSNGKEENRGIVSVAKYFEFKYNKPLKFPHLPCLEVGNPSNKVYLPLEFCKVVSHQRLRRSLTNQERSEMTSIAGSQPPKERLKQCERYIQQQFGDTGDIAQQNRPFLYEFGIDVSKELLEVESRVIEPPKLKYYGNRSVVPQHGEWEMWRNNSTFLRPARLEKWIIINISFAKNFNDQNIEDFSKDLCLQAKEMGMNTTSHSLIARIPSFTPRKTFTAIKAKIKEKYSGLRMILFITPMKTDPYSDDIYSEIKLLGDVENGFATQCVNVANIWNIRDGRRKWNRSYLRQLMLKINPKLGGTNVALSETSPSMPLIFKDTSLMIIGADVNHPAPADRISPSISAVVGSYNNEFSDYYTTISMQPKSREEMIKKLDKMVIELLQNYQNRQKELPQKIIFYRDGVSDGQFQHVIDNEYSLLKDAFKHFGPKYVPKITFIIVQKRHHTRFIPKAVFDDRNPNPKFQNISPGTVVEKSITHKTDFDFYLCSHEGRLGTSRAAHYYVLTDENGFNSNEMCKMTYYLCHIYARCTKSVSIPAPVYYADLAAYRAKVHASGLQDYELGSAAGDISSVTSGDSEKDNTQEESKIRSYEQLIKVLPNQKQTLYFC